MNADQLRERVRLAARIREDPLDLELAWEAARFVDFHRVALPGVGADYVPVLVYAWALAPEDRAPEALFLQLMGLDPEEAHELPEWWVGSGRARYRDGRAFDRWSGLPLMARRREDGRVMMLVPAGEGIMGADGLGGEVGPARPVDLDPFYIDRDPVPRELLAPAGEGLTWDEALAYAEEVGGRLPSEAELERALRGTDGRPHPWGEGAPPGTAASPFGLGEATAPTFFACDDGWEPQAHRGAPRRNPRTAPEGRTERVTRGASPPAGGGFAHLARRAHVRPDHRWLDLGLRVVYAVGPATDGFPEPGEVVPQGRDTLGAMTHDDVVDRWREADPLAPRDGEWYLDLGCGPGAALETLVRRGGWWVGLDVRAAELAKARAVAPGAHLVRGKGGLLPFRDGSFAGALCVDGIARFVKPAHPLAEAARVLRPGGIFVLVEDELEPDVVHAACEAAGFEVLAGGAQAGVLVARRR